MEIANFFWGGELSELEKNCMKSFHRNGFKVKLWSYEDIQLENIETCDANLVMPKKLDLLQELNCKTEEESSLASFSDYFRLKVVSIYGGWWFDADCFCLKDVSEFQLIRKDKRIVSAKIEDKNSPHHIMNGAFWLDEILSKKIIEEYEEFIHNSTKEIKSYGFFGPEFFTNFVYRNNLYDDILPSSAFYAIHWTQSVLMTHPENIDIAIDMTKDSLLTHIWTTPIPANYVDKNNPRKGSFLDMLYSK